MARATLASLKIKINSYLSPIRNTIILKEKAKNTNWYSVCSQFYNTCKTKQNSLVHTPNSLQSVLLGTVIFCLTYKLHFNTTPFTLYTILHRSPYIYSVDQTISENVH
jgi:hypothetical protein